jgi:hypothetical protein
MNFELPATPVCLLSVAVLIDYDCLTVMFQCKVEKISFYRESTEQSRCCSSIHMHVNTPGVADYSSTGISFVSG